MRWKYAVTHPGGAHQDDLMTAIVAAGLNEAPLQVKRASPTEDELADPQVLVFDIGGRHEAGLSNFDHHQLPRGTEECALSLLLKAEGLHEIWHRIFLSYETLVRLDSTGPIKTASAIGITKEQFLLTQSMAANALLSAWEATSGEPMWDFLLHTMGRETFEYVEKIKDHYFRATAQHRTELIKGVPFLIFNGLFESKAKEMVMEDLKPQEFGAIVSRDDRGEGWSLYRVDDHPRVDFGLLEGKADLVFVHPSGFIAKTHPIDLEKAVALATLAVV